MAAKIRQEYEKDFYSWTVHNAKLLREGKLKAGHSQSNQRIEINDLMEESLSLKKELDRKFHHAYEKAVLIAAEQTGIDEEEFPRKPPFTLKECLRASYLPD
jgi:hypothetical protein